MCWRKLGNGGESSQDAIALLSEHIQSYGGGFPAWYVGITHDPDRRFTQHKSKSVPSVETEAWEDHVFAVAVETSREQAAREAEAFFVGKNCKKCTQGGPGGDGEGIDLKWIYTYFAVNAKMLERLFS